jgi:hypothetical protein
MIIAILILSVVILLVLAFILACLIWVSCSEIKIER